MKKARIAFLFLLIVTFIVMFTSCKKVPPLIVGEHRAISNDPNLTIEFHARDRLGYSGIGLLFWEGEPYEIRYSVNYKGVLWICNKDGSIWIKLIYCVEYTLPAIIEFEDGGSTIFGQQLTKEALTFRFEKIEDSKVGSDSLFHHKLAVDFFG